MMDLEGEVVGGEERRRGEERGRGGGEVCGWGFFWGGDGLDWYLVYEGGEKERGECGGGWWDWAFGLDGEGGDDMSLYEVESFLTKGHSNFTPNDDSHNPLRKTERYLTCHLPAALALFPKKAPPPQKTLLLPQPSHPMPNPKTHHPTLPHLNPRLPALEPPPQVPHVVLAHRRLAGPVSRDDETGQAAFFVRGGPGSVAGRVGHVVFEEEEVFF